MQPRTRDHQLRLLFILPFAALVFPFVAIGQAAASAANLNLDACISYLMGEASVPGISLSTIENGSVQPSKAYGYLNNDEKTPVSQSTVFEAASLSKPLFTFIVLNLAERRMISLDKPLVEYLPYPRFHDQALAKHLTARTVLSHQTGLPNWGGESLEFQFTPGTDFGYSGEGYLYLQKVLEQLTGLTLPELAQREVFGPLGMKNSRFSWDTDEMFSLSKGHDQANRVVSRRIPEPNAASSLHTTAGDFALFVKAWMRRYKDGDQLFRTALQPSVYLKGDERGAELQPDSAGTVGWGLGWGVQQSTGGSLIWHWGDNGVFRAFVAMNPDKQNAFVLLTNSQNGLAMAGPLAKFLLADMKPTFKWLNYESIRSPGWSDKLKGYQAEAIKDVQKAAKFFTRALEEDPDNEVLARRIKWLQEREYATNKPAPLTERQLALFPGHYGPRNIIRVGDSLFYQRNKGNQRKLIQIKINLFIIESVLGFRLEVVLDDKGQPGKLVGHYLNGWKDESPRSADLMSILLR